MNRSTLAGGAIALLACAAAEAGQIDPTLESVLEKAGPNESVSTLVFLNDQVDVGQIGRQMTELKASRRVRHESVVVSLQEVAAFAQPDLLAYLNDRKTTGGVTHVRPFWISNAIHVEATPAEIRAIADRNDVFYVFHDYELELIAPVGEIGNVGLLASGGPEPGIEAVRAPEVWELGITGNGVLVSTLDTGVDGTHEALASRWRGVADSRYADNPEWAWFDPVTNTRFPQAFGSHGTHTMGSVLGGAPGRQVGVAPGAQWIHCAVIDRVSIQRTVSDALLSFEWLLDPDGNPATEWDVPQTCSNSWRLVTGHGYPPCDETFWAHLDACEAAGIVIIFAAGNEGGAGLGRPPDRATDDYRTFAVAAVDANDPNWPIASFSSRGPTFCTEDGSEATKPDIAGPGVNVISSVPGGYGSSSGTSMSTPHLNGVVALMLEANPALAVDQVKQIIYETAFDLGDQGEDNAYGWGMVDAFEAVQRALADTSVRFLFPSGRPGLIDPNGGERIRVVVEGQKVEPEPGTGKLYYRATASPGGYTETDMEVVDENVYDAVFPAFECGALVEYYFSVETTEGEQVFNPFSAPDATYSGEAYTGPDVAFADDFEADRGWTVVNTQGLDAGQWERGVPAGGDGGPDADADGSGQCYVTGLAQGEDVDGLYTTLVSPILDVSDPEAVVEVFGWLNNQGSGEGIVVDMSDDGGKSFNFVEVWSPSAGDWRRKTWRIADLNGVENSDQFMISFRLGDFPSDNTLEGGIDGITVVNGLTCADDGCDGDVDGSGEVDFDDVLMILSAWGPCDKDCPEDLNDDQEVGFDDLLIALAGWGPCE